MLVILIFLFFCLLIVLKKFDIAVLTIVVCYPSIVMLYRGLFTIGIISIILALLLYNLRRSCRQRFVDFPFLIPFLIAFSSYAITILFTDSGKINTLLNSIGVFILPLLTWVVYEPGTNKSEYFRKVFTYYLLFITVYGIYEGITTDNPIMDYLLSRDYITTEQREDYVRFGMYRARSLTIWCSVYGATGAIGAVYFLNRCLSGNQKLNIQNIVLIILCVSAVFISGTRTIVLMFAIMLLSVYSHFRRIKKRWLVMSLVMIMVAYSAFPVYFDEYLDALVNHEDAGGSSMELREAQLAAALHYFSHSPIWGNGIGFTSVAIERNSSLLGAESIVFSLLIDRGIIGIASVFAMWLLSIAYLVKHGYKNLAFLVLGLAFGKVMSLLPTITEVYIFPYVIMLMKDEMYKKQLLKI